MMTRKGLRTQLTKALVILEAAASFTTTTKDDEVVELVSHLVTDDDHFNIVCDLLNIPPDAAPVK